MTMTSLPYINMASARSIQQRPNYCLLSRKLGNHLIITFKQSAILLDFAKAFDTVPHQRLLSKISYYGIAGNTRNWIEHWLADRTQKVIVDGVSSSSVQVQSGVPQGTVLGPLLFLVYINDIGKHLNSTLKLFADDCMLMRNIETEHDTILLQQDLDDLTTWADVWQMNFNSRKCYSMHFCRTRRPVHTTYKIGMDIIQTVDGQRYLGIELDNQLSWKNHVDSMTAKAGRTLGLLRRNLHNCPPAIKQLAYTSLVRPQLE